MHLPTLVLGASLASSYARQQFGPGPSPEQLDYPARVDGQNQRQGANYGQNEGQNEGQNGKYNGNIGYDGDVDNEDVDTYNSLYNDVPSAQPTPVSVQALVHAPASSPIHSTFAVRPTPAIISHAPIASSSPKVKSPASGYAYNYPSPAASKPVIYSSAPAAYQAPTPAPRPQAYSKSPHDSYSAASQPVVYRAPAPHPQAYSESPHDSYPAAEPEAYQDPARAPSQAQPEVHQAPAPAPIEGSSGWHKPQDHPKPDPQPAPAPPQPKPTHAPAQPLAEAPAPVQEPTQLEPEPEPQPAQDPQGPVDENYGEFPDPNSAPDSLPDSYPSGQSEVAPVDPLQPGTDVAPVLFNKPRPHGQDQGNTFCVGTCHADPEELKCEKPYSEPVFKSAKGCYMCCFTSGEF